MLIKEIEKYSRIHGKVDAFMIVNKDDVIQYSAMVDDGVTFLTPKNVIGKNLFEMYPNLTRESSTHCRVMDTGKPILDEQQLIIEKNGRAYENGNEIGALHTPHPTSQARPPSPQGEG